MSVGILNTALSGLAAFQRSLETTSNNIANVNTDGYSRQRAELATRTETYTSVGYVGNGVDVTNVSRTYDQFVNNQVRASTSAFGDVDAYHTLASRIDNVIADQATGLAPALQSFFEAAHGVADDPTSIPMRQSMLSETDILAQNFNTMAQRFTDLRSQINKDMQGMVGDLNDFAKSIADLNSKIVSDIGRTNGKQMPNELLDQRDVLLNKVAEKVDVSVVPQPDGSVSVFIGQGQPLVIMNQASSLSLQSNTLDPTHMEIRMAGQDITKFLSGGELIGTMRFRDELLDPAQQRLGLLAAGVAIESNKLQQNGFDLNGNSGATSPLFAPPVISVTSSNPASVLTANYVAPPSAANLQPSDYRVTITGTGPTAYTLTRLSDNTTIASPAAAGFTLAFDGNEAVGNTFLVKPTFYAAVNIADQISDPRKIAAATTAAGVPGDNSNALSMANLEQSKTLLGGTANFSEGYGQLVALVGTLTHSAEISRSAQDVLLKQATASREAISGVNLDEEAANLIKFQNAYQASAKVVSVVNSLFDTLIGAVR
jgi:flagellar hook-associated protein 1 FlgK